MKSYNLQSLFGPFLLTMAALSWAVGNVLYHFISYYYPVTESMFGVYLLSAVVVAPFFRFGRIDDWKTASKQLFLMVIYHITSAIAYAWSNPNDVTAILTLSIFMTPILAYFMTGKQFYKLQLLLILLWSFTGIVCLVQPPILFFEETTFTRYNLFGYALAVVATLARSLLIIYQNQEKVDEMSMTFWTPTVVSVIFGSKSMFGDHNWDFSLEPVLLIVAIAVLYQIGTFCSFAGWARTDPMISALTYQTQMVFTFLFAVLVGVETDTGIVKIGGIILVLSSVCTYQLLDHWRAHKEIEVKIKSYKLLLDDEECDPTNVLATKSITELTGNSSFRHYR